METLNLSLLLGIPLGTIVLPEILRTQSVWRWHWFGGLLAGLFALVLVDLQDRYADFELIFRALVSTVILQGLCGYAFYRLFLRKRV